MSRLINPKEFTKLYDLYQCLYDPNVKYTLLPSTHSDSLSASLLWIKWMTGSNFVILPLETDLSSLLDADLKGGVCLLSGIFCLLGRTDLISGAIRSINLIIKDPLTSA